MRKILVVALMSIGAAGAANAGTFTNGGFETGDFSGWSQGSGYWGYGYGGNYEPYTGAALPLDPNKFFPGGTGYNAAANTGTAILSTAGTDAITGGSLLAGPNFGNYVARINDSNNNYSVSAIRQTVTAYSGTSINFAWWAVLEASHGVNDSDNFSLTVTNDSKGTTVYSTAFSSAVTPGFAQFGRWFSSGWQNITLAVDQGDSYTITLLGSDCPYGGHAGYVYLDGFGRVSGGGGDTGTVPEPASLALVGLGLAGLGAVRRRNRKSAA